MIYYILIVFIYIGNENYWSELDDKTLNMFRDNLYVLFFSISSCIFIFKKVFESIFKNTIISSYIKTKMQNEESS